jgi:chromosome segregation ATPase
MIVETDSNDVDAPSGDTRPRPGRPRKYASDADRVRAFRARQKAREQQGDIDAALTATPSEVVGTLERTLTDLRTVTGTAVDQFTLAARQITAAVDRLTDPAALDGALHRANVELAQAKAAYETELADLRTKHDAALDDRANADAAVRAVDAELEAALRSHSEEIDRLTAEHRATVEDLDRSHRTRLAETAEQVSALEADRDSRLAAAAAEIDALRTQLRESENRTESALHRAAVAESATEAAGRRAVEEADTAARHLAQVTAVSEQRIADLRSAGESAATTAADTVTRLERSVEHERGAAAELRQRVDALRDELERSRIEEGRARTTADVLRDQLAELRAAPPQPATEPG